MLSNNRIIWSDNGTLIDLSADLNEILSGTSVIPIVADEDYIYIGSDLPFNHRHFVVKVANDVASVVSVELWSGNQWHSAVDVIDQTAVSGKTLAQTGVISWVPERTTSWARETSTENIPELDTIRIYDYYWARLSFSADLKSTTELKLIGHCFSNDLDLYAQYPDFGNTDGLTAFQAGKTTWDDQHILAAEYVIQDLREMNIIQSPSQLMEWRTFKNASVHKVAEIIFRSFGKDFIDPLKAAQTAYKASLKIKAYNVDQNASGSLDPIERTQMSEFLTR